MRKWLREPVAMTRLTLFVITGLIGVLGGGGVLAGATALRHAKTERDRAIAAERLTANDVSAIAKRIFRIESPSSAELVERIQQALRICADEPKCRRALRATVRSAVAPSPANGGGTRTSDAPLVRPPAGGHPRGRPARPRTVGDRRRRRAPEHGGSSGSSAPAPPPSEPRPIVVVNAPTLPGIGQPALCTPLVGVNC